MVKNITFLQAVIEAMEEEMSMLTKAYIGKLERAGFLIILQHLSKWHNNTSI